MPRPGFLKQEIIKIYQDIKKEKGRNPYIAEVMEEVTLDKSKTLDNKRVNIKKVLDRANLELTPGTTDKSKETRIAKAAESTKAGSRIERVLSDADKEKLFADIRKYKSGTQVGPQQTMNIKEFAKYFPEGTSDVVISRQINRVANDMGLKFKKVSKPEDLAARKVKTALLKKGDPKNFFTAIPPQPGTHRHHMRSKKISPSLNNISRQDVLTNSVAFQKTGVEPLRNELIESMEQVFNEKKPGWEKELQKLNFKSRREANKVPKNLKGLLVFEQMDKFGNFTERGIGGNPMKALGKASEFGDKKFTELAKFYDRPQFKEIMEQTMNETAGRKICRDGCFIKVGKQNPGLLKRTLQKLSGKGRIGAAIAGAGAVGGGAYAMMGGPRSTDDEDMKYNATTGQFDNAEGEPETQEGVLNWIADNPVKSGLVPIPALLGANHFFPTKGFASFPALVAPVLAAEKLTQYQSGMDAGDMATDPLNVLFAAGYENAASRAAKEAFYKDPKNQKLLQMKNLKNPRNIPGALRSAVMSPRSAGTKAMFGLGKGPLASSGLARVGGMALRATPLGWGIGALTAANYGWNKYKDVRDTNTLVDSMVERGRLDEGDAQTLKTLMKQGWLGTTSLGAKLLDSEELAYGGENLNLDQQKQMLEMIKGEVDTFQEGREDVTAKDRQQELFSMFSDGGRVGMKTGGMDRRTFLKWIAGLTATATGILTGKGVGKKVIPAVSKNVPESVAKFSGVEGMPDWFPRAVAQIKANGKLLSMADKDYIQGDMYEMMVPVTRKYLQKSKPGEGEAYISKTEYEKVVMEDNPLTGEIDMQWTGTDNFGDDTVRNIHFKPGQAGFQKFGVDPDIPQATEYQRVKMEEPEFTYTEPDQSIPDRSEAAYLDIFEEGDDVVAGLQKMVTKDQSVDDAFQKRIFKDASPDEAVVPAPEGQMTPEGDWAGEKGNEIIGGDIPEYLKKKASGGIIETGNIARRPGAVPPLSGPTPHGDGIMGLYSVPKKVNVR